MTNAPSPVRDLAWGPAQGLQLADRVLDLWEEGLVEPPDRPITPGKWVRGSKRGLCARCRPSHAPSTTSSRTRGRWLSIIRPSQPLPIHGLCRSLQHPSRRSRLATRRRAQPESLYLVDLASGDRDRASPHRLDRRAAPAPKYRRRARGLRRGGIDPGRTEGCSRPPRWVGGLRQKWAAPPILHLRP